MLHVVGRQALQAVAQLRFIHRRLIGRPAEQLRRQLGLVCLIARQVQALAVENQRGKVARRTNQRGRAQLPTPVRQRRQGITVTPRPLPGPARQRQADIAIAEHLAAQRGGGQHSFTRTRIEALQAGQQGAFQRAEGQIANAHCFDSRSLRAPPS